VTLFLDQFLEGGSIGVDMNELKDLMKLIISGLLVSFGLALGLYFIGVKFLQYVLLLFFGYLLPYARWKVEKRINPIPKIYFIVSGAIAFLIFFILWRIHGNQGSAPINLLDIVLTLLLWPLIDAQIRKLFKITNEVPTLFEKTFKS
jgi:hypothetical protein